MASDNDNDSQPLAPPSATPPAPFVPEDDPFQIVSFGDDYDRRWHAIPPPPPIVEGLLHLGDVSQLAGASKTRKTWLAIQLAWCVASGTPFLGHKTTQGRVLYVNYELKPLSMLKRQARVARGLKLENEETKNDEFFPGVPFVGQMDFERVDMRGKRMPFSDVKERVIAKIKAAEKAGRPYSLIIIDPLYRTLGGGDSERSDAVMASVMGDMAEIAECGPAVFSVHHYAKGDRTQQRALDRASGSGVIARFIDSSFAMDRNKKGGHTTIEPDIRDGAPVEKFAVRFTDSFIFERADDVNPNNLAKPNEGNGPSVVEYVAAMPDDRPFKTREAHEFAKRALKLEKRQSEHLLTLAKGSESGLLVSPTKGVYEKSAKGKQAAQTHRRAPSPDSPPVRAKVASMSVFSTHS